MKTTSHRLPDCDVWIFTQDSKDWVQVWFKRLHTNKQDHCLKKPQPYIPQHNFQKQNKTEKNTSCEILGAWQNLISYLDLNPWTHAL